MPQLQADIFKNISMVVTVLRRSERLREQRNAKYANAFPWTSQAHEFDPSAEEARNRVRRQCHSTSNTSCSDVDHHEAQSSRQFPRSRLNPKDESNSISYFLDDSAASSSLLNESEEEESDVSGEQVHISCDYIQWATADDCSRSLSYDSRCEPGNQDYEFDDFVVGDDDSEEMSDVEYYRRNEHRSSEYRHNSTPSTHPSSRSSSSLFVSIPENAVQMLTIPSWSDIDFPCDSPEPEPAILFAKSSADISEEILDALVLFSRRCNQGRAPLRFRLKSVVMRDREVKEALDSAVKFGMGRKTLLRDGSIQWTVGPRR